MGNKCYATSKSVKSPSISTLKTYVIPKKGTCKQSMLQPNEKPQALKFAIEIEKIKCKNLNLVPFFIKNKANFE